jgi:hypothetical protein
MSATVTSVTTPVFDPGLKSIKFFNGRLLSAEELTTEQRANGRAHERLGRALGDGVVRGLEVSAQLLTTPPTVTVQAGLAFNRAGQAVRLGNTTLVGLYAPAPTAANTGNVTPFAPCGPVAPGIYLGASGVYLLTIAPAAGTSGRAPVLGLADGTDKCNANYIVEGVQFGLVSLPVSASDLTNTAQLRNIVAAQCFGSGGPDPLADPFGSAPPQGAPPPQGLIEGLRGKTLTDAEVPLAVVGWTVGTGITFVDMWSARRRVARPDVADDTLLPIGNRYPAVGEACLLQFQDHLQTLLATTPTSLVATTAFKYLPPLGLLPLSSPTSAAGFIPSTFFKGLTVRNPIAIEGARAEAMVRASLDYPLVDLSTGEMFWLFQTRQNMQSHTAHPFVFFVTGQMPYFGESRFDVARYDFSAWT